MTNNKSIIVFAPHPDDEVIACGGTIIKKIKEGYNVKIIFITDGSHSHSAVLNIFTNPTPAELAIIRQEEAKNAAKMLGVDNNNLFFLNAEDTLLIDSQSIITNKVKEILIKEQSISEVYIPHIEELHQDHSLTNTIVLSLVNELHLDLKIFQYIVWNEETEKEFNFMLRDKNKLKSKTLPNLGEKVEIDISNFLEQKIKALKEHKSQIELISPKQKNPVLPIVFVNKLIIKNNEVFWIYKDDIDYTLGSVNIYI